MCPAGGKTGASGMRQGLLRPGHAEIPVDCKQGGEWHHALTLQVVHPPTLPVGPAVRPHLRRRLPLRLPPLTGAAPGAAAGGRRRGQGLMLLLPTRKEGRQQPRCTTETKESDNFLEDAASLIWTNAKQVIKPQLEETASKAMLAPSPAVLLHGPVLLPSWPAAPHWQCGPGEG